MNIRFISAGAGTGKTHRLTELLHERLASDRVRPQAVIATTFTRKAAAELLERVRQGLTARGEHLLATSMGQALIGTVNSVCSQLLARHAFEAGLSPQLEVLSEEQQPVLFAQAVEMAMRETDVRAMNALAVRLGIEDWRGEVKKIVDLARANDIAPASLAGQAAQSVAELLAFFPKAAATGVNAALQRAVAAAIAGISGNGDYAKGTAKYLDFLQSALHRLEQGTLPWSDWVKLSKEQPAVPSKPLAAPVAALALQYDCHPQLHADIADWVQRLFALATQASATYQSLKAERGLMDFVDQEHEVLRLLDHPAVAESLRAELDLLLVDEFQDTSPIQLALFLKLANLATECIWVGDVKQAIYGFRGTDPELMRAVVDGLEQAGRPAEVLGHSWRSRPALVAFTNAVFTPAFAPSLPASQVVLAPKRQELLNHPPLCFWQLAGRNAGQRADAMATCVTRLLARGIDVLDKETRQVRPLRAGDIALLSRTNAKAQGYAAALTAVGVPVALEQPGLLATPEVHLALACLRRLVDSDDTLASAEIVALKSTQSPESWLEDRLDHLAQGRPSQLWGVDGALQVPALQALEALRERLVYLSPSELLDDVLTVADLRTDAKAWGPTEARSEQRLANLETLRGLAVDYEEQCRTLRGSATASGLLLWLYALADRGQDVRGVASQADAVRVLTHHGAKGLEWPVVITADLETETRGRLWGATVVSDTLPVDIHAPLEGRRLHYWPWPFGKQSAGIAVAARIAESPVARADQQRQRAEEVRLLYVSFTRARDVLVLPFTGNGEGLAWLDTTGADWVRPAEESLNCPGGEHIPCSTETCGALESTKPERIDTQQPWFSAPLPRTPKLPARLNPSGQPPVDGAHVGATVELGARVTLRGTVDSQCLGDAVHNILAAELIDPESADRREMASRVLTGYGLASAMEVDDVLDAASRLRGHLTQAFRPTRTFVEWPVAGELDNGQRVTGWIDVLVETGGGWIIIDHKAFPGLRADWSAKALEYSGQLATYRRAVEQATARPVLSQWVHFPIGGGLVEIVLPPAA